MTLVCLTLHYPLAPHQVSVIAVAMSGNRDTEVHFPIRIVWLLLSQIPINTAASEQRAGAAPIPESIIGQICQCDTTGSDLH